MLMATQLLKDRICDIIDARESAGLEESLPTLKDIEKTHIIHFQSKFKPFVALAYEYQQVKPQSGASSLVSGTSTLTYSIPQFGDFLSDMVLNVTFSSASCGASALPTLTAAGYTFIGDVAAGTGNPYQTQLITLPDGSTLLSEENITLNGVAIGVTRRWNPIRFVDGNGLTVAAASVIANTVYYCDFPGERVMNKVRFGVNGNPIDDYTAQSYVYFRNFRLPPQKVTGYYRDMGMELPRTAYSPLLVSGTAQTGSVNNVGYPLVARTSQQFYSGPQTPQAIQNTLNMWCKLLFWFNLDQSQAIVSAAIPYGQRFLDIDLGAAGDILFQGPAVYVEVDLITDYYTTVRPGPISGSGITAIWNNSGTTGPVNGGTIMTNSTLLYYPYVIASQTITGGNVSTTLYVNNIFTIPEVHDIYVERIGFSLIRVHKQHQNGISASGNDFLLSNFKYPVEFFFAGCMPTANFQGGANRDTAWYKFGQVTTQLITNAPTKAVVPGASGTLAPAQAPGGIAGANISTSTAYLMQVEIPILQTINVTAHGVTLYPTLTIDFFNQYLPEAYARVDLVTPNDPGLCFINFCLYPYCTQPSGHINASRAREFYIQLNFVNGQPLITGGLPTQNLSPPTLPSTFFAEASSINFLLVSDGSAVLRYTT